VDVNKLGEVKTTPWSPSGVETPDFPPYYLYGDLEEPEVRDLTRFLTPRPQQANIRLHSEGGWVSAGLAIYDLLREIPKVTITATGICASAATIALLGAQHRLATPNTHFLIHNCKHSLDEPLSEEERVEVEKRKKYLDGIIGIIYLTHLGIAGYNQAMENHMFNATFAKSIGLVTAIVGQYLVV